MNDENRPVDEDDWENVNERDKDSKIRDDLKHMDNVKQKMHIITVKDILVKGGVATLKDIKKTRQKMLAREKRKIDIIVLACRLFGMRIQKRKEMLQSKIQQSRAGTYTTREYDCKN